MAIAYLSLGSNLGNRQRNLKQALRLLSLQVKIDKLSSIYETEPVGYQEQPPFLNTVCQVSTNLSPYELLHLAKDIERQLGRKPSFANAPRPIDIDILIYNNKVVQAGELTIPHPRLVERAFVLVPLAEISPELVHPEKGRTISELLNNLESVGGVQKWSEAIDMMGKDRR